MEELVGETLIQHLEFDSDVFDIVYLEGAQQLHFWGCGEFRQSAAWLLCWHLVWLGFGDSHLVFVWEQLI